MKKIITYSAFLLSFLIIANTTIAQSISYGFKIGYGFASVRATNNIDIYTAKKVGVHSGSFYIDIPLSEQFSVQTGLALTGKGADITVKDKLSKPTWANYKTTPYYLEIPANLVYKIPVGDIFDRCNFIFGAGPYIGTGIAGKVRSKGKTLGKPFENSENISFNNNDKTPNSPNFFGVYKTLDFGLGALVGIEYKIATLHVNYQYGAINVNPGANLTPIDRMKHRGVSVSIGVRF